MYCHQCGKEVGDAKFCPYCGAKLDVESTQGYYQPLQDQYNQQQPYYSYSRPDDRPSFGYALLSFMIPIVGIVLFIIWNHEYPQRAKSCLKGFVSGLVVGIISACCLFAAIGESSNDYNNYYYDDYDNEFDTFFNSVVEVVPYE